jgi:hypothetical protein
MKNIEHFEKISNPKILSRNDWRCKRQRISRRKFSKKRSILRYVSILRKFSTQKLSSEFPGAVKGKEFQGGNFRKSGAYSGM